MRCSLDNVSVELDNMARFTKEFGLKSGERLGKDLSRLKKCQWFDSHLPEGSAFIENCCIAIELVFRERIEEKSSELSQTTACLRTGKRASVDLIKKIELLLPELSEIDKYVTNVAETPAGVNPPPQEMLASQCIKSLEEHTHRLSDWANTTTNSWDSVIRAHKLKSIRKLALKLDLIYAQAKALNGIQKLQDVVQKSGLILKDVSNSCQVLSALADSELQQFDGNFTLKADIISSIKACSDLFHIQKHP